MFNSKCEFTEYCPLYNKDSFTCNHFGGPYCGTWCKLQKLTEKQRKFYRTKSIFYGLDKLLEAFIRKHKEFIHSIDLMSEEQIKNHIKIEGNK